MDDSTSDLPQPRGAPPVICKGHVRKVRHPRFRATTTPLLRATHHDQEAEVGEQGKVRDVVQHPCGHAVQLLPGANVSVPTGHGHTLRKYRKTVTRPLRVLTIPQILIGKNRSFGDAS